jgi:hypothetical protein
VSGKLASLPAGEPTTRECTAAIIQLAIVLRDLAVVTGYPEFATRITHAVVELDYPHSKAIER